MTLAAGIITLIQGKLEQNDWIYHLEKDGKQSRFVYIRHNELKKRFSLKNMDTVDVKELVQIYENMYPNYTLEVRKNVAENSHDNIRFEGKHNMIYFALAFPFVLPGMFYLYKACQGTQFVIRTRNS